MYYGPVGKLTTPWHQHLFQVVPFYCCHRRCQFDTVRSRIQLPGTRYSLAVQCSQALCHRVISSSAVARNLHQPPCSLPRSLCLLAGPAQHLGRLRAVLFLRNSLAFLLICPKPWSNQGPHVIPAEEGVSGIATTPYLRKPVTELICIGPPENKKDS